MSHFTVIVVGDDVEGQLAPYDENITVAPRRNHIEISEWMLKWYREQHGESTEPSPEAMAAFLNEQDDAEQYGVDAEGLYELTTYNPDSKWDWYTVGGRWRGYFKLKAGVLVGAGQLGEPDAFDNEQRYDADVARKGDIDIEWMRDQSGETAGRKWDRLHEVVGDLPVAEPWKNFLDRSEAGDFDINKARELFAAQPWIKAINDHDLKCRKEDRWEDCLAGVLSDPIEEFSYTREEYVQRARDRAIAPFAYVKNGEWFEAGRMGWWGMSTATEDSRADFAAAFNAMLDALPDDTILTLIDCHI